jgi:hypothetical protein
VRLAHVLAEAIHVGQDALRPGEDALSFRREAAKPLASFDYQDAQAVFQLFYAC